MRALPGADSTIRLSLAYSRRKTLAVWIYGTTQAGGVSGCTGCGFGLVFKLDPAGNLTVLHTFMNGADGGVPRGGLTRDSAGNLYGTTYTGGAFAGAYNGVVFKIDSTGSFSVQ